MTIATYEGVVENGQIRLANNIKLPENARVYVVIPDVEMASPAVIYSPHLVYPEQAADFVKEIIEAAPDAQL